MADGLFAEQGGKYGYAVDVVGGFPFTELGEGGEHVGLVEYEVAHLAGLYLARPADEVGYAESALVEVSLAAAELHLGARVDVGSEEAAWVFFAAEAVLSAVVAGEEHYGVVLQLEFAEQLEHLAEVVVHHGDHGGVVLHVLLDALVLDPFFSLVASPGGVVLGDVVHAVRRGDREVTEEWLVLVFTDELEGFLHDGVLGVGFAGASAGVAFQWDLLAVAYEVGGVEGVGVHLVVIAEENIEAVLLGHPGGVASAAAPFAEAAGGIALLLEDGGYGGFVRPQGGAAVVGPDGGVAGVLARHQIAAQRGAHGGAREGLGEAYAFLGELVDIGRLDVGVPHVGELVVGELVGHDVYDVGLFLGGETGRGAREEQEEDGIQVVHNL